MMLLSSSSETTYRNRLGVEVSETWWDRNAINQLEVFKGWIGDHTAVSKVEARRHVISQGYKSLLDCGCGTCSEYHGYQLDAPEIVYFGIDSCADLVNLAKSNGIPRVIHGDLECLPLEDSAVDVVYIRHVLEHLENYETAITQAVRVARREVLINWFIPCTDGPEELKYDPELNLRHNRYNRLMLEKFLSSLPKVEKFFWSDSSSPDEEFLHILNRISC